MNGRTRRSRSVGVDVEDDVMVDDDNTSSSCITLPCGFGNNSCLISISEIVRYLPFVC